MSEMGREVRPSWWRRARGIVAVALLAAAVMLLLSSMPANTVAPVERAQGEEISWPTTDWEVSTPEAEGMNSGMLEGVGDYCDSHGCRAVVIARHGRVVWERYWGDWDEGSTDIGWSIAKSVTSALVGIAVAEGHIQSIEQSVTDFIEEWQGTEKEPITLRHLLSMTSGLEWTEDYYSESDVVLMFLSDDQVAYVLGRPLAREPGTYWYYSSGDTELFSRILLVATGMEAKDYAQEKIFDVIGMPAATWPTDNAGQTTTYCCVTTNAREFAKFGYLYLREGRWEDQQVIPQEWVLESTQPSQGLYPGYGYYWWLPDLPDAPSDTYEARGFQTKRIYVIPSLDIVAVRLGEGDPTWDANAFLKPVVEACAAPPPPSAVGGLAELPSAAIAAEASLTTEDSGWTVGAYAALAGGVAGAGAAVVVGGWYARRRWLG